MATQPAPPVRNLSTGNSPAESSSVRNSPVRSSPARKKPSSKIVQPCEPSQPSSESLLKSLIDHVIAAGTNSSSSMHGDGAETEEIILDAILDGDHYLLIRMPRAVRPRVQLSPREQEIVRMVAQGHPNKIIADVLNISSWTVCTHLRRIFAKLGVTSRAAMVARILENGNSKHPQPSPERQPAETRQPKASNFRADEVRTASALAQGASVE